MTQQHKILYHDSFSSFRQFMIRKKLWKRFKRQIFRHYGWINVENMLADNRVFPSEYLIMPILIYVDKSTDWGKLSMEWVACYYKIEEFTTESVKSY